MPETRHLEVHEVDGFPDVLPVHKIRVPNNSLTDLLAGAIDLSFVTSLNSADFSKQVNSFNITQTINAGESFQMTISLTDTFYKRGVLILKRQILVPDDGHVTIVHFSNVQSKGVSITNSTYLVGYDMANGDSYLSHQLYSTAGSSVALTECWIDGGLLKLTFTNYGIIQRTLSVFVNAWVTR